MWPNMPHPRLWVRLFSKLGLCTLFFFLLVHLTTDEEVRQGFLSPQYVIRPVQYLHLPPSLHVYERKCQLMSPEQLSTFVFSLMGGERRREVEIPQISSTEDAPLESVFHYVISSLSTSTRHCSKMVRVGGKYCNPVKPDGYKMLCLDHDIQPSLPPSDCLVYSFGIGHDFTFETAMAKAGCSVYAFDLDYSHLRYPREIAPGVFFFKLRIGVRSLVNIVTDPTGKFPYTYITLKDLMAGLKHTNATIDVLKMDIEHDEWDVLEKSLFQTKILERTKQLALEMHLDRMSLRSLNASDGWMEGLRGYARVISGLEERGFRLSSFEPNYKSPKVQTRFDRTFHLFFETLWVNVNLQPGIRNFKRHTEEEFENFDPVDLRDVVRFHNHTMKEY